MDKKNIELIKEMEQSYPVIPVTSIDYRKEFIGRREDIPITVSSESNHYHFNEDGTFIFKKLMVQ